MDDFINQIKSLSRRVEKLQLSVLTEEATKTSIIMPFFQVLGYDVFNPEEFLPEFTADVGIKRGEKVDYAIIKDGKPLILIEAKAIGEKLEKHDSQLYRYFGTTDAKFAILTNGIIYRFYTDLDELNKMDTKPFFEFHLIDLRDNQILELSKFRNSNFDMDNILASASDLRYTSEIKHFLMQQLEQPSEDFVSLVVNGIYPGRKTRSVLNKFGELVKRSFRQFINEQVNDLLHAALEGYNQASDSTENEGDALPPSIEKLEPTIVTTEEELEGYVSIRYMLRPVVEPERITYRDTQSYFNVILDNNIRKWLCRLGLHGGKKYIQLHDDNRTTYYIERVSDIEQYMEQIVEVAARILGVKSTV